MRILLVEDEHSLARLIEIELLLQGMSVEICYDGKSALALALGDGFDLVILDWILPDIEGIQICRILRDRGSKVPIIIITAKQGVSSEVRCLSEGADDYIAKPFDMEQLVARIRAVTRRAARLCDSPPSLARGSVTVEPGIRAVYNDGVRVHLTNKEYEILVLLLESSGRIVTKEEIRASVWGEGFHLDEGVIAVHVKGIRDKLKGVTIENVRGIGYMIPPDAAKP
jgi:two-component system OmpR family response regulator